MKHLRTFVFIALLMAIAVPLNGCTSAATPAAPIPIKIGGGYDLSASMSSLDLPSAQGAKLAVKEINAAGGVLGRPLELIVRDSKSDKVVTAQIAQQFVNADKVVAMIGFSDSEPVLVAGPTLQKAGLPFITSGATSPKIPAQIGDMAFMAAFGDNVQAAAGAEYSFKTFGKSAYLLWDADAEYTTLLARYFNTRFTELGGAVVLADSYPDQATDFAAQITKLKALPTQPDFYYVAAMPQHVGPLVKQFRAAGITGPIVGGDGYDTPDLISVGGAAANNVYFSTHALMDSAAGTEGIKKFMAAYKTEYGHDPENAFAALGYDTIYLLADAIKRAGSTDANAIKAALEQTSNLAGITGSITFSADTHVPRKGVTIIAVKDGRLTLGAQVVPEKVPVP
jgi:branched-chain amino acid transport system substrate-binding protein